MDQADGNTSYSRSEAGALSKLQFSFLDRNKDGKLSENELMEAGRKRDSKGRTEFEYLQMNTTAYSDDFASCGWNKGVALPSLSKGGLYVNLSAGKRPSGSVAIPFTIHKRKELDDGIDNRVQGMYMGAQLGLAAGLVRFTLPRVEHLWNQHKQAPPSGGSNCFTVESFKREMLLPLAIGSAVGLMCPVGRYWADTSCKGRAYYGTTSLLTKPNEPRPNILSPGVLFNPVKFVPRLLTGKWRGTPGTIAADLTHYPYGTKFFIKGYGWGVVEDRGGAIMGSTRLDLFHVSRQQALKWGRRNVKALKVTGDEHKTLRKKKVHKKAMEEVQHEVQDGESLYKIVKVKYPEQMCSLDDVRKANNLPEGAPLSIGQRIRIPNCGKNI